MRKILFVLLIISAFLSCRSNTKQAIKDTASTTTASTNETQALIKKFKPIIQGVWVKSDYIDRIIKTKSPIASEDKSIGIVTMYINTDSIKNDSLVITANDSNVDYGFPVLKFKKGERDSTLVFNGGELGYKIENGDTILISWHRNADTKKIETTKYIKVLNSEPTDDVSYGLELLISKNLIAGNYIMTDTIGRTSNVTFSEYGKVTGIPEKNTYYIAHDLSGEPMSNLDCFVFNFPENAQSYTFKINADTLKIFEINANADSTESILGELVYKFVRTK